MEICFYFIVSVIMGSFVGMDIIWGIIYEWNIIQLMKTYPLQ